MSRCQWSACMASVSGPKIVVNQPQDAQAQGRQQRHLRAVLALGDEQASAGGKLEANDVHGKPERVSAELPGDGAIALATLEPNSGGHCLQFRPELTPHQHRREVAYPAPEPLGEAAGSDRPIRECDVAHRLCAEPQGPEPDGLVDHPLGSRGRWWTNRFSVEPELLQVGEALLVRRGRSPVRPSGLPIRTMFGAFWRAIRQRSGAGKLNLHK